jgi:DNA primase catalytic subunit
MLGISLRGGIMWGNPSRDSRFMDPLIIGGFYIKSFSIPDRWRICRKHFRAVVSDGRFVKLNKFRSRLNMGRLRDLCVKIKPIHLYFSVLDWLFPDRVGVKSKAKYAFPIGGEYVVDVDSYVFRRRHRHVLDGCSGVCIECLMVSRDLTIQACEAIERYYSNIAVVFSGRRGFHIHVLDFKASDWARYDFRNPIRSHEAARFRFSRLLSLETYVFDEKHFTLSVDPMRIVTVPNSLNAETGLKCIYIGDRRDLEKLTISRIMEASKPNIYCHPEP